MGSGEGIDVVSPDEREAEVGDVCGFVAVLVGFCAGRGEVMRAGDGWILRLGWRGDGVGCFEKC